MIATPLLFLLIQISSGHPQNPDPQRCHTPAQTSAPHLRLEAIAELDPTWEAPVLTVLIGPYKAAVYAISTHGDVSKFENGAETRSWRPPRRHRPVGWAFRGDRLLYFDSVTAGIYGINRELEGSLERAAPPIAAAVAPTGAVADSSGWLVSTRSGNLWEYSSFYRLSPRAGGWSQEISSGSVSHKSLRLSVVDGIVTATAITAPYTTWRAQTSGAFEPWIVIPNKVIDQAEQLFGEPQAFAPVKVDSTYIVTIASVESDRRMHIMLDMNGAFLRCTVSSAPLIFVASDGESQVLYSVMAGLRPKIWAHRWRWGLP